MEGPVSCGCPTPGKSIAAASCAARPEFLICFCDCHGTFEKEEPGVTYATPLERLREAEKVIEEDGDEMERLRFREASVEATNRHLLGAMDCYRARLTTIAERLGCTEEHDHDACITATLDRVFPKVSLSITVRPPGCTCSAGMRIGPCPACWRAAKEREAAVQRPPGSGAGW